MDVAPGASGDVRDGGALLDIPSQAAVLLELDPSRINVRARSFAAGSAKAKTRKAQEIDLRLTRKEMRFFGFVPRAKGHRLPCCSSRGTRSVLRARPVSGGPVLLPPGTSAVPGNEQPQGRDFALVGQNRQATQVTPPGGQGGDFGAEIIQNPPPDLDHGLTQTHLA